VKLPGAPAPYASAQSAIFSQLPIKASFLISPRAQARSKPFPTPARRESAARRLDLSPLKDAIWICYLNMYMAKTATSLISLRSTSLISHGQELPDFTRVLVDAFAGNDRLETAWGQNHLRDNTI
jgi:hypothetical protein